MLYVHREFLVLWYTHNASASRNLAIQKRKEVSLSSGNQQPPWRVLSLFQGTKIQGGTFNITINRVDQHSPNLSLQSGKRRHYMIESDSAEPFA